MSADIQAEQAFAQTFLNILSRQPVTYADDYQQPLENSLKRVPVLQIPVPPLPERTNQAASASASSEAPLTLRVKSLKLKSTYTLTVSPSDTIAFIKAQLHAQYPGKVPKVEGQSFLLGGKALSDQRMMSEYLAGGEKKEINVSLVEKKVAGGGEKKEDGGPIVSAPSSESTTETVVPRNPFSSGSASLDPRAKPTGGRKHQRIPSVVLSPSPANDVNVSPILGVGGTLSSPGSRSRTPEPSTPKEIVLDLDEPEGLGLGGSPLLGSELLSVGEKYRETVKKPEFWEGLIAYLRTQFQLESDVHLAFEDFLGATKGSLTANEIAKIRDWVGVVGMAGT